MPADCHHALDRAAPVYGHMSVLIPVCIGATCARVCVCRLDVQRWRQAQHRRRCIATESHSPHHARERVLAGQGMWSGWQVQCWAPAWWRPCALATTCACSGGAACTPWWAPVCLSPHSFIPGYKVHCSSTWLAFSVGAEVCHPHALPPAACQACRAAQRAVQLASSAVPCTGSARL